MAAAVPEGIVYLVSELGQLLGSFGTGSGSLSALHLLGQGLLLGVVFGRMQLSLLLHLSTTVSYFQPTAEDNLPTVVYFLPCFNLNTLKACGTTTLFFLSYGGGIPSKTLSLSKAA